MKLNNVCTFFHNLRQCSIFFPFWGTLEQKEISSTIADGGVEH